MAVANKNTAPALTGRWAAIRSFAMECGFHAAGVTLPDIGEQARSGLQAFMRKSWHGDMDWMAAKLDRRADPKTLWPDVRSVIVLGLNYGPGLSPLEKLKQIDKGNVSVYAQGKDYHDIVKKRLKRVARWVHSEFDCEVKVFVDTAPVAEKPLAQKAGLGWQGKHTNVVSRDFGSWLFLGEIYTTLELPKQVGDIDHCGNCRRCLDACPTNAFPSPYQLDARRCISYLTIEHKGHIPEEFRSAMGNRIYGCDDCLAVCPWNKFARQSEEAAFHPREKLAAPLLAELAGLDDASFRSYFAGSPVKRTGRDRFVRNVLIAVGNSGGAALAPVAKARLEDPSPLVRAMAVWALSRLLPAALFKQLRSERLPVESDGGVRAEWK